LSADPQRVPLNSASGIDPYSQKSTAWTAYAWTGDEKAMVDARAKVDAAARKPSFADYFAACKSRSDKNPSDSVADFTTAYAGLIGENPVKSAKYEYLFGTLADAQNAVMNDNMTRTYDGARIRFLYETMIYLFRLPTPHLMPLSERLLRHSPQDFLVLLGTARLYDEEIADGNRDAVMKSIDLCKRASLINPTSPTPYGSLAKCYDFSAHCLDNWDWKAKAPLTPAARRDVEMSLIYAERSLQLSPASDQGNAILLSKIESDRSLLKRRI
jgi:hypothetical protein